jgi:prepilin-type N-terminal cleavage/methylation domain-containing protein
MKRRSRRGFTLLEVMASVTILGLLAAIAVPNLMAQSRKAKASQRTQQQALIETACKQYLQNNARWPTGVSSAATTLSSTWNPAALGTGATFDPDQKDWKELQVATEGKTRFQYQLTGNANASGGGGFVLTVRSDLDGNGVYKIVTRSWEINQSNWTLRETIAGDMTE